MPGAVVVPRSRFAPVKSCNDLFILRSDAFKVTPEHTLVAATDKIPLVKLDDKHYKLVDSMDALVKSSPSMIECTSLTVVGKVVFLPGKLLHLGHCSDALIPLPQFTGKQVVFCLSIPPF